MISITPAIKSLKIRNLGIIRKADMKFTKGINIIYGVCGGGKTTVLNAIRHLTNGEKLIYGSTMDKSAKKMEIGLEFLYNKASKVVTVKDIDYKKLTIKTNEYGEVDFYSVKGLLLYKEIRKELAGKQKTLKDFMDTCSQGEKSYINVVAAVDRSCEGQALLLDGVFCMFDKEHKERAFEFLKKSKLQVIMTARREDELVKGANVLRLKFSRHRAGRQVVYL